MSLPEHVTIVEVGPRDGLQSERDYVPTDQKIELIERLSDTGLKRIEITSFVRPGTIPQLKDSEEVVARLQRRPGISYSALVPNYRGLERAIETRIGEIALFVSASETHNQKNVRMSIRDSLNGFYRIAATALAHDLRIRGYVVTAFGCEYEGRVPPERVEAIVEQYRGMGVHEVSLGDTTGMANPVMVREMVRRLGPLMGETGLALHFHDTRGTGLANALAALLEGVHIFDCSIGGLGGCPYPSIASGNIATEDLVGMLHEMGIGTGIDLDKLLECARFSKSITNRELPGHLHNAGRICWEGSEACGRR
ncbi:MAG: hydroxymethylglutaryl-CoA lyase [Syntrophobacteraceae bacterium]